MYLWLNLADVGSTTFRDFQVMKNGQTALSEYAVGITSATPIAGPDHNRIRKYHVFVHVTTMCFVDRV